MTLNVYICQPIDQTGEDPLWSNEVHIFKRFLMMSEGIGWIYDPKEAFRVGKGERSPGLMEINDAALSRADLVVAWLPAGVPTIGVPIEIDRALRSFKPTIVITDAPSWAVQYPQEYPIRVCRFDDLGADTLAWAREKRKGASEDLKALTGTWLPTLVHEGGEKPRVGYPGDAGLDLYVSEDTTLHPGEFTDVPCGVSVELPVGTWGLITGRSSTIRDRGLLVNQGVIDEGYRGPLFAGAWNLTADPVPVKKGERIAQLILHHRVDPIPVVVESLSRSARDTQGFGSSGA